jgi:Protein of unknown function (DUF2569)
VRRILILLFLLSFHFISFANAGDPLKPDSNTNWVTLWLSFFFGLLFTILFRFLNRRSKKLDQRSDPGLPLSGWIVFLGINLFVRMIVQLYFFWTAYYYSKSAWNNLAQRDGISFQSLIIFELFLALFAIAGTGALIYWFLGRRDIFPSMFTYYVIFYLLATFVLVIVYREMKLPGDMRVIRRDTFVQFFRIVYAGAWVVFVLKSPQVKKTFIYPP